MIYIYVHQRLKAFDFSIVKLRKYSLLPLHQTSMITFKQLLPLAKFLTNFFISGTNHFCYCQDLPQHLWQILKYIFLTCQSVVEVSLKTVEICQLSCHNRSRRTSRRSSYDSKYASVLFTSRSNSESADRISIELMRRRLS